MSVGRQTDRQVSQAMLRLARALAAAGALGAGLVVGEVTMGRVAVFGAAGVILAAANGYSKAHSP